MSENQVVVTQPKTVSDIMHSPAMSKKLNEVWMNPRIANSFMSSVISVANGNPMLRKADPMSIIGAAMVAATLQLQVVPTLGQAYIIPYGNKAQIQIGYLGLLQLCMRSGQFKHIIAVPVHDGEMVSGDEFNENWAFDKSKKKNDTVVGYYARFELINGFSKAAYWGVDQVKSHATKFSQAFRKGQNSPWKSDFDAMACKTVLKSILKYAPKSVEMQSAITFDQSVVKANTDNVEELDLDMFTPEYVDNDPQPIDATSEEVDPAADLFGKEDEKADEKKKSEKK